MKWWLRAMSLIVTQNLAGEGEVLVISIPGGKVSECRSSFSPSQKELLEQYSGTKISLVMVHRP
jgi:hypothetical protein